MSIVMKMTEKPIYQKYMSKLLIGSLTSLICLCLLIKLHSITTHSWWCLTGTRLQTETNPKNSKTHLSESWTLIIPHISGHISRRIWHSAVKMTPVMTPATLKCLWFLIGRMLSSVFFVVFPLLRQCDPNVNSNVGLQHWWICLFLSQKGDTTGEEVQLRHSGPPGSVKGGLRLEVKLSVSGWLRLSRSRLCNIIHTFSSSKLNVTLVSSSFSPTHTNTHSYGQGS